MSEKYADILNRSWDDIPTAKVLPEGSWLLKARNVSYFPAKEEGKSARVAFFYTPREAMDDVDKQELEALGADYDLSNNDIVKQFFINRDKDWAAVRKHIELHGVDVKGLSQAETFKAIEGQEVMAYLGTKQYTNSSGQTVTDNDPTLFSAVD